MNWADALATSATILMGESNECRPLAIIKCPSIVFTDANEMESLAIPLVEDLYYPLLKDKL
jgi:F420-0:gamma-glutamyl ligase